MSTQSELALEQNLVVQLVENGYENVCIKNEADLLSNLKTQLEKFNERTFTDEEFKQILNHLTRTTNVFEKAKILRDKFSFKNADNETVYVRFLNMEHWCKNEYQVTNQITVDGKYQTRFDVTMLINGLPLVQIELKKRGLELREAFNQIDRYKKHSYHIGMGLFQYIQIFVISNGVNTKYFALTKKPDFKFTFYWTDENNRRVSDLESFTKVFLDKCHVSKMITRYTVLHEGDKALMILRPYQYFAVEKILERVKNSPTVGPSKNGYVWHTTGSGKTLTSFKASQILSRIPKVDKVVFCVDRVDLDYKTTLEFNAFSPGSVDGSDNTKKLVKQFADPSVRLIVTTIQKLNTAITRERHQKTMDGLKDKKVVFIFDECHRSQFGDTHKNIVRYFNNHQMFGFTGTPIFTKNAATIKRQKVTTAMLFGERLHTYVITDAIKDQNVLPFSVEYTGRYEYKDNSRSNLDIDVEAIDTAELLESEERLSKIAHYIIGIHDSKTYNRAFTGMFCISNVKTLIKYYDLFRRLKREGKHDLRIASIFSYTANEAPNSDTGEIPEEDLDFNNSKVDIHTRDVMDKYIEEYNQEFKTSFSTKDSQSFNDYYKNVAKRVIDKEIDLLFVVNMFLTGFDSKKLNTLYVDKNLKYHGLIQAYSRTNRVTGEKKSHGNIVVFRNLKQATDDSIELFSTLDAKETILIEPYEDYVEKFDQAVATLLSVVPTVGSVDDLLGEDEQLRFIRAYRNLMRIKNAMETFVDFTFDSLSMDAQTFADYGSKYLDLYNATKSSTEKKKESILNEVDFQLELIRRDEINVMYILRLLAQNRGGDEATRKKREQEILTMVSSDPVLSTKRELIEKFILENLPTVSEDELEREYEDFLSVERRVAFEKLTAEEDINPELLQKTMDSIEFSGRFPTKDELVDTLNKKPSFRKRISIGERLVVKLSEFVGKFMEG
ncbi:type I restriction enzyme R subunit [Dyadobacter jejuensis]|uniref:Type I restriction enzyme endonuclease subunit n=1 Tax=Dyadobacter jejuensis TaxID=1082580 RepID=A0A316AT85_9BACT|nr:type I restriction endonuclease subunit R [Dyadobacter jejuensis]PWJ60509.1 type I restriction enzyme R subunit [Dyadobacter jejuensis]